MVQTPGRWRVAGVNFFLLIARYPTSRLGRKSPENAGKKRQLARPICGIAAAMAARWHLGVSAAILQVRRAGFEPARSNDHPVDSRACLPSSTTSACGLEAVGVALARERRPSRSCCQGNRSGCWRSPRVGGHCLDHVPPRALQSLACLESARDPDSDQPLGGARTAKREKNLQAALQALNALSKKAVIRPRMVCGCRRTTTTSGAYPDLPGGRVTACGRGRG